MQKFRIKVNFFINALLALCSAAAVYIIVTTAITLSKVPSVNVIRISMLIALLALTCFIFAIVFGALIFPYYVVGKDKLKVKFGLITIAYDIKDITEFIYYKDKGKLVMYYGQDKFAITLLAEEKHEDFMKALRKINPEIIYDNKINEND